MIQAENPPLSIDGRKWTVGDMLRVVYAFPSASSVHRLRTRVLRCVPPCIKNAVHQCRRRRRVRVLSTTPRLRIRIYEHTPPPPRCIRDEEEKDERQPAKRARCTPPRCGHREACPPPSVPTLLPERNTGTSSFPGSFQRNGRDETGCRRR
ncbi:hypothetical protein OH77DRAFT_999058 [Trametes cingulata]|nr:hypothetical protein OH77DRAFT_999058 [Trametes cingulata]